MTLNANMRSQQPGPAEFARAEVGTVVHRLQRTSDSVVHLPGEPSYDELRRPLNRTVDPYPMVVVEATRPADVQAAVRTARDYELPFAVQATGHGTHAACTGGLLLKTTNMASVLVDPDRRIARVGPGARWRDVITAAAGCGLAPCRARRRPSE